MFPLLRIDDPVVLALIDTAFWPVVQLAVSWIALRRPESSFREGDWLYRTRGFEQTGDFYRKYAFVRIWKKLLPDGAALFGGFRKKRIESRNPDYLARFMTETCRGEWAHGVMLLFAPIPALWNPPWAALGMAAFGLAVNLPPIITQRHNRIVLRKILSCAGGEEKPAGRTPLLGGRR